MRCTSEHHALGCNGECRSAPRPLTAGEQARLDAYMDRHHPRVFPKPARLHVVTMPNAKLSDDTGRCEQTMTCPCERCEIQRQSIKPRSERNADPFRRAA